MLAARHYEVLAQSKELSLYNPAWFCENILQADVDAWQLHAIEAVADVHRKRAGLPTKYNHKGLNRISIHSCHGTGKTHFLGFLMHWWNWCFYGMVVCTAPKENQIKRRLWPRYRKILREANDDYAELIKVDSLSVSIYDINTRTGKLELNTDWGCVGETASDPDNMSGYHDEPQLILVDEASAKRLDPMFPVLEGTLTTDGSVLVQIGNPTRTEGEFYNAHNKAVVSDMFYQMHIIPTCMEGKYKSTLRKIVLTSDRVSTVWVQNMITKYGDNSPVVKIRAFGEFAEMEANQLIALQWLEDARDIEEETDGSVPRLRISVDVMDGGEDFTVITASRQYDSFKQYIKQKDYSFPSSKAPILSALRAIEMFNNYGGDKTIDEFVIDAIGTGSGTAGYLALKGYKVVAHKGGMAATNKKKYRNMRTQIYCLFRDAHRDSKIRYSPNFTDSWEDYIAQVCSIKLNPNSERVDDIETKQSMLNRGIKSPDKSDSAAMAYSPIPVLAKEIEEVNEQFGTTTSYDF